MPASTSIPPRVCALDARVRASRSVCREHVTIEVEVAGFPASTPGQFLQLRCADGADRVAHELEWPSGAFPTPHDPDLLARSAYLRRPFSIADRWQGGDGADVLAVISRNIGVGTAWLERLRPGDTLNLTGPLGRGFSLPDDPARPLILVGGGVGIPPLIYLARLLRERGARDVTVIFGVTTRDLLPVPLTAEPATDGAARACIELAGAPDTPAIITSDDGSIGLRGVVTEGLLRAGGQRSGALVYACGPERMLAAVAHTTRTLGLDAELCIERPMGCGLGTCLSCVVRVPDAARPDGWRWALSCTEGPVFARDALLDYAPPKIPVD